MPLIKPIELGRGQEEAGDIWGYGFQPNWVLQLSALLSVRACRCVEITEWQAVQINYCFYYSSVPNGRVSNHLALIVVLLNSALLVQCSPEISTGIDHCKVVLLF